MNVYKCTYITYCNMILKFHYSIQIRTARKNKQGHNLLCNNISVDEGTYLPGESRIPRHDRAFIVKFQANKVT